MTKKHRIIKGAVFLFMGKTLTIIIEVLQILLIPRILGPENMGFYAYWLSVYFIAARILGLGGTVIIIRYIPELRIKSESMIPSLIKKIVYMKIPAFFIILGLGILIWTNEISHFMIIAIASLLFSLGLAGEFIVYSYNRMGTYALIPLIRLTSRTILVIALFYLFHTTGIVFGIFVAPLIGFSLSLYFSFRLLPRDPIPLDQPFRKYLSFGFWVYLSEALQGIIVWLITILSREYIKDMTIVGYFGIGAQICFSIIMLVYFINESILPSLVEFRVMDNKKLRDSVRLAWKYTNILLFPLIFGGYVLAGPLITFFIGKDYIPGTHIIKLFFPAVIFFALIRLHNQILFVYDKKIKIFLTQLINLLVFLGAWFYLIGREEINYAPLSLCLGTFVAYLFILFHANKIVKVENYMANFLKPLMAASLMALVVNFFKVHSIFQLLFVVILGFLSYGLLLFVFRSIGKYDFEILKEFLKSVKIFGAEKKEY